MPRCPGCWKAVVPKLRRNNDYETVRTWQSGPELIRLSKTGCELCVFIRKHIENVARSNVRRIRNSTAIVLGDYHGEIILDHSKAKEMILRLANDASYYEVFSMEELKWGPIVETYFDPVRRAREFLEACDASDDDAHFRCQPEKMDTSTRVASLPRRLLDLSALNYILTLDVQECISTGRATVDELSNYCTLSYRWGDTRLDCMLSTQFDGHRVLRYAGLPQTFKDAIVVARGLKIRYLWVDALCIIQPSAHGDYTDWNAEGPRMWLIYQNAICTIAATCSEKPNDGFLHKTGSDRMASCSIFGKTEDGTELPLYFWSSSPTFYDSVVASRLNRRGWVAQERLLSRRMLHFTEEGVFWECQALDGTDQGRTPSAYGGDMGSQHASRLTFQRWLHFIEFYSMSNFTRPADRLITLSSIARSVPAKRFGKTYFAGIWVHHILECLSWFSDETCSIVSRASCLAIAPSWSWASVPGRITYTDMAFGDSKLSWVELKDSWASLHQPDNQFGNLKQGALKLLARMCKMNLPTKNAWSKLEAFPISFCLQSIYMSVHWDELQDHSLRDKMYTVVPLSTHYKSSDTWEYMALVVTLLPTTTDGTTSGLKRVYRRIGCISWRFRDIDMDDDPDSSVHREECFDALFSNAIQQTIVLI